MLPWMNCPYSQVLIGWATHTKSGTKEEVKARSTKFLAGIWLLLTIMLLQLSFCFQTTDLELVPAFSSWKFPNRCLPSARGKREACFAEEAERGHGTETAKQSTFCWRRSAARVVLFPGGLLDNLKQAWFLFPSHINKIHQLFQQGNWYFVLFYAPKCKACQVPASEKARPVKLGYVAFHWKLSIQMLSCTEGLEHMCEAGVLQPAFCYCRILVLVTYSREQSP